MAFQLFESVAGRLAHIVQTIRSVQLSQLAPGRIMNVWRQPPDATAAKDRLRPDVGETADHEANLPIRSAAPTMLPSSDGAHRPPRRPPIRIFCSFP